MDFNLKIVNEEHNFKCLNVYLDILGSWGSEEGWRRTEETNWTAVSPVTYLLTPGYTVNHMARLVLRSEIDFT